MPITHSSTAEQEEEQEESPRTPIIMPILKEKQEIVIVQFIN